MVIKLKYHWGLRLKDVLNNEESEEPSSVYNDK